MRYLLREMYRMSHEDDVRDFMRKARIKDSERFREICEKYPVQSRSTQLRRAQQEAPLLDIDNDWDSDALGYDPADSANWGTDL